MALNMCEMWSNGIKIAFFSQKLQKIAQQLGASLSDPQSSDRWAPRPQTPRLWYVWVTLAFSKRLQSYAFALFNYNNLKAVNHPANSGSLQ